MRFLYPLGLLGLLAIPVIILIYILQSKYTEQTVSSTYLWTLSDKFLKKKKPLSGLTGWISLLLQILTVAVISLIIAHPIITIPGGANDYCFILDASASMNAEEGRDTRFEKAKNEIEKVIRSAKSGSTYTLISVSSETVRIYDGVRDKDTAIDLLETTSPTDTALAANDLLAEAQKAFDRSRSAMIYLATDKHYETHESIELISVGNETLPNYALFDVDYSHTADILNATANVTSYTSDAQLEVKLLVDDAEAASKTVSVEAGGTVAVSFTHAVSSFASFRLEISNADGYRMDNGITTYNLKSDKTYSILIVSDTEFFLHAAIDALVDSDVDIVTPDQYEKVSKPYGLYIFDSYKPEELPAAAVWLINVDESIERAGFSVRGHQELREPVALEKSTSSATNVNVLLEGIEGTDLFVGGSYIKYSTHLKFATLFSCDANPVIFAGANELGHRQVVFGFDLHQSDIALSIDFVMLLGNLLEYSFPDVISETNYTVGDTAPVNIVANSTGLKAISPSGRDIYMESDGTVASLELDEVGTYVISVTIAGTESSYRIYSAAHPDESLPALAEADFSLSGEKEYVNIDGEYDPLLWIFIALAILFIADWGMYCYEKYQLR